MVARSTLKSVTPKELHLDSLPRATQRAFIEMTQQSFLKQNWYLAGGTALALQTGHRQSVDLDFFTTRANFPETQLERALFATDHWQTTFREAGTVYGVFMKAKMSFIAYPFFKPSTQQLRCGTIKILLPHDIAAMKIIAISQRGRKRDFVDLYWYCHHMNEGLDDIIRRALRQYPGQQHNIPHFFKSLLYFNDAEADPMPTIYFSATWNNIKSFFQREVSRITKTLYF